MSEQLNKQLTELQSFVLKGDQKNIKISEKGTYWQIDHTLKVLNGISGVLKDSHPADYKPKFNLTKLIIMTTGHIPRGKGRAPKHTLPEESVSKEELISKIEIAKKSVNSLKNLPKDKTFKHPLFGWMNLKDTIKFMGIHTHHHIKIIRDIEIKN